MTKEFPGAIAKTLNTLLKEELEARQGVKDVKIRFGRFMKDMHCHDLWRSVIPFEDMFVGHQQALVGDGSYERELFWATYKHMNLDEAHRRRSK